MKKGGHKKGSGGGRGIRNRLWGEILGRG